MRILITGGAGFLGSHLAERLLNLDHQVTVLDNLYTGREANIKNFFPNQNFSFVHGDVTQPFHFDIDMIFNLACPASPIHYQKHPVTTIKTSLIGAINSLELARKLGIPIFQASTSEVYGDPTVSPQTESYWGNVNPVGIRSCYDEGKRAAETLFSDYRHEFGLEICIARIFNTYGPRLDFYDGRVVSNLIHQALLENDITIYGDGSQSRSFCYVDDLIDAFVLCMSSIKNLDGPINLGNPVEFTILELANQILEITNSNSRIIFKDLPGDDPKQRKPNIDYARTKLGWEPTVSLQEGLARTILDFESRLG
jgi:UDP-glucuronate decarboxylase